MTNSQNCFQHHKGFSTEPKPSFHALSSSSRITIYCSVLLAFVIGVLIQLVINRFITIEPDGDSKLSNRNRNDLFSRPPRQQGLVRFPSDVSWFTSTVTVVDNNNNEDLIDSSKPVIKSHAALDAKAFQNAKQKLQAKTQESLKAEAHASYKAAIEMMDHGKKEKARKLLQHAILLDPLDADILNAYGEFLIKTDIVMADHMFKQASIICPTHIRALINLQKTAPLVEDLDAAIYNRIAMKRDLLIHIPEHHPALRRLKKELYYQHIYHTVAIEGNTLNLHQTRAIVETRMTVGGKSISEHNEVIGLDAALSYINSTLLNRIGKISIDDILEIHKRVLGFADPIEAGQLRNTQVFVGDYIPPRPGEVQTLMEEFVDWLNSEETAEIHPIKLAAIAHYKLVTIHPFYDGNGRTSRLLMNLILMHAGYPPVMIRVQQKHEYYKHLETGNRGDIRPFIRFIADCTEVTVDEYISALTEDPRTVHDIATYEYVDDGRTIIVGDEED
ncbi:FICD [Bugula neritina]|uniref:protein adenylyltransferase n=1 Tax=Bugula neritina TaxID=10212 RepID=A0A7J7K2T2_BUGNE|nr:FICD [Bugula neritina]